MELTNGSSREVRVPWDRLRAWIESCEAFEREHDSPAALSQAQLEAISVLISFGEEEPEVGDRDHVSALILTIQASRALPPTFVDLGPVSVPVDGHVKLLWHCVCSVKGYGSFPREGYGIDTGKQPPLFQSKKKAKQYAAKHALQYMKDSSNSVSTLAGPPGAIPDAVSSPSPDVVSRRLSWTPASQAAASGSICAESDGLDSVLKQVSELAFRLGIENPSYSIDADEERPNFFSGRPIFKHGGLIPSDLGVVTGVLGKRQAKMQMAEKVLEWLQKEQQNRHNTLFSLVS